MKNSNFYNTVIKGDYCVGCGLCSAVENSPIKMGMDIYGKYIPLIDLENFDEYFEETVSNICPFTNEGLNEDQLGRDLFSTTNNYINKLGYINSTFAGYVKEGQYRNSGSSGGFGSWILNYLLSENIVDSVIHVGSRTPTENDDRIYEYKISSTKEEILNGAKSKYYPVEMSGVIRQVLNTNKKYVIVGLPCFIKSIRAFANTNKIFETRVVFTIGLVCGHLKSKSFAELLGWQVDINPNELKDLDFRTKLPNYGANQYGITAKKIINKKTLTKVSGPVSEMYGTNWGLGFFKYKACDYCDDVTAETADITIGDAWLPKYINDHQGTNILIIRNPKFLNILNTAENKKLIYLESISPEEVIDSQSSGLFHRREGLEYRLYKKDKSKSWRPKKRVQAKRILNKKTEKIQDLRIKIAEKSHTSFLSAKQNNDLQIFKDEMAPLIKSYYYLYRTPILTKIKKKISRIIKRIV